MNIDWTTFALEIVNFLALVWILQRFLYRPVMDTLRARREGVERTLAEARASEQRARALQVQFEDRLAEWNREKTAARVALEAEFGRERARRLEEIEQECREEKARHAAVEAHHARELQRDLETRALAQARRFTAALLARLATPALEERLVELLLADLGSLGEQQVRGLRDALADPAASVRVTSAFVLDEALRARITDALSERLGTRLSPRFEQDPALLAGLRVSLGPWHLQLDLADEANAFDGAARHGD